MIEITNRQKGPVQLLVKSSKKPRSFTCLNIPGVGKGKNVYYLEDERDGEGCTIDLAVKNGLISKRYVKNKSKGE